MKRAIALLVGLSLLNATLNDPRYTGEHPAFGSECRQYATEIANADFCVYVVRNREGTNSLDIGVKNKSFALEELELFFKLQRHKDFIVVGYDKDAQMANLKESQRQLKKYFQDAGYKRILLMPGRFFEGFVYEDFRTGTTSTTPPN